MAPAHLTLIIATYNWKEALCLTLASVLRQTRLPDEIIVADDGSTDGTGDIVARFARETQVPLLHSWHEDKGFRLAEARNKAILRATGEYIILLDGDIIIEPHFVEDHLLVARPGLFVQGGRVLLSERKTNELLSKPFRARSFSIFDPDLANRKNAFRSRVLSRLFSSAGRGLGGIRGCNLAFFRSDALAINGFDEDFQGWGREDSEFACRLMNNGVLRYNLRFAAVAYHLHHASLPRDWLDKNDAILARTVTQKISRCDNGITK